MIDEEPFVISFDVKLIKMFCSLSTKFTFALCYLINKYLTEFWSCQVSFSDLETVGFLPNLGFCNNTYLAFG